MTGVFGCNPIQSRKGEMALDGAWNMYIFREGKTTIRGARLADELIEGLLTWETIEPGTHRTELLDLLLRAGELECALADVDSPQSALAASVTDDLAASLVMNVPARVRELARRVSTIQPPEYVTVTPPEGFAYYALHPLDYADLVKRVPMHSQYAAVVGVRSIGTTISAVVQAALRDEGMHVERITARPSGHPYNRQSRFDEGQLRWIGSMRSRRAEFIVADEGPGMSGSSFLSVGDALLASGVQRSDISFLCSRVPDPASLTAPEASNRWPSFRSHYTHPTTHLPGTAGKYIAGGIWRAEAFGSEGQWPASWLQMERLKFLSKDGTALFKFEGLGRFGSAVQDRAAQVADAGFGPAPLGREEGFGAYRMLQARALTFADASSTLLQRLAEYCAFRARAMHVSLHSAPELQTMLQSNVLEEFGTELTDDIAELRIERPVIADARMLPHKWIDIGRAVLKVDSSTHGDDHFFPGPTDIAWDLAGAIVEWDLSYSKARFFLDSYQLRSHDRVDSRLPAYLLAYSVFRMAYSKMAAASSRGMPEERRLVRDYLRYRSHVQHYVQQATKYSVRPLLTPSVSPFSQLNTAGTNAA